MGRLSDEMEFSIQGLTHSELIRAYKLLWIDYKQLRLGMKPLAFIIIFLCGIILALLFVPMHFSYTFGWGI